MEIDLSEIFPPLRDLFAPFDRVLVSDGETTFVRIDPGNCNSRMIGFLQTSRIPHELPTVDDPDWFDWRGDAVAEKALEGAGVFWMCPGIPEYALIRIRLASVVGQVSWGRRFRGAVRSEGDFLLFSTEHLPGEVDEAMADFSLERGDYEVFLDEHFHWPIDGFLDVGNDQILFTVTFVPSRLIRRFPSPALIAHADTEHVGDGKPDPVSS